MKLGKRPARSGSIQFKQADVLRTDKLPPRPKTFGHTKLVSRWGQLGNDKYGCCVWAGAGHETMLTNKEAGHAVAMTTANVLKDYSAVTGFNPHDPSTDNGTDMQAAASYRRKTGVLDSHGQRHLIDAYLEPAHADVEQLLDAVYYLGGAGIGFLFPDFAMDQFNRGEPWDVVEHAKAPDDGHYVPGFAWDGQYISTVSWGRIQRMTPAFFRKYTDEAISYVYPERIGTDGLTLEGFNRAQLASMLSQVTKAAA